VDAGSREENALTKEGRAKEREMAEGEIVIHGRYAQDGTILEIGERPEGVSAQQWFNLLCVKVPEAAKPLAGGRIVFRVSSPELATLKSEAKAA
jgi:hypothetical protein